MTLQNIGVITSTVPLPTGNQTHVNVGFTGSGGVASVYTVTTGKTFYLFGMMQESNAGGYIVVYANDGSTVRAILQKTASQYGQDFGVGACPIAVYTSGQAVNVQAAVCRTNIWGVEQ